MSGVGSSLPAFVHGAPIATVIRKAVALGLLAALAGCASVPREYFYALDAVTAPERAGGGSAAAAFAVIVEPATVPELVDRPQFVVSVGESRVAILEQQRWAEPLRTQISRIVAMNLTRLLGGVRVSTTPPAGRSDADYRVTLDVQRFESRPGDAAAVQIVWMVRGGAGTEVKSGSSTVREKTGTEGYDALVAAFNRALATVSREIAAAIRK